MINAFDSANVAAVGAVAFALGYTTFWALKVRRALAIHVYRSQALGIALIASILGSTVVGATVSAYLFSNDPKEAIGNSGFGLYFVYLIVLFYWVDASALAARRSDPLSRDTLHWSKVRYVLWAAIIPAPAVAIPVNIYFQILSRTALASPPPAWTIPIFVPGIVIPPLSGAILLPIIGRRTVDPTLRKHLKWFGFFVLTYVVFHFLVPSPDPVVALVFGYVGGVVGSYCLYRSVMALVPAKAVSSDGNKESLGQAAPITA